MKTNPNSYLGYSDSGVYYIAQGISKKKFVDLVQAYYHKGGHISKNWVNDRVSEGANEQALEKLKNFPGHFLAINESNEVIIKVKL